MPSPSGSAPGSGGRQPGSAGAAGGAGNSRTAAIQAEIDNTVNIMQDNIKKVAERGERLDSLQDKTDTLAVSAQGFRRGANRVRKAMWWKDFSEHIPYQNSDIAAWLTIRDSSIFRNAHSHWSWNRPPDHRDCCTHCGQEIG